MNSPMLSNVLRGAVSLVPWRWRASIRDLPVVASLQRWLVARFLEGSEFVHTVDAGPARGLVYPIRLPEDKGVWTGTYELRFATVLADMVSPGSICLDVGGWHGFYAGLMALAGASKVFVFEPLPANCDRIRTLIELNSQLPIELVEMAVADRAGTTQFQVMSEESMGKLAESPFQRGQPSTAMIDVRVITLDDLLAEGRIEAPSLIKVDVEGAELRVLHGAAKLLREHRPTLFLELHSPELARDCRNFVEDLGYTVETLEEPDTSDPAISHFLAVAPERHLSTGRLTKRNGNKAPGFDIPILLYHHLVDLKEVDPASYEMSVGQFVQQLDLLIAWDFTVISFATLLRMMDGREPRRERIVIVTFDDAFRSFYELGFPALKQRGMSATVFVPAGEIGGANRWDSARGYPERVVMSEAELQEIASGGMEIGSHGWAHRSLPECSEAEAHEELTRSRGHLAGLGLRADVFAYPYGHYSAKTPGMVRAAGYSAAVSIFSKAPSVTANRFAMRRICIHPGDTPWRFRCKVSRPYLRFNAMRGVPRGADAIRA